MSTVSRAGEWNPRVSKWKRAARLMLEWIRIVVEWIIHLNAALVNSSLGRTQHKERRTSHLLEFAVGVSPRNVLLLSLSPPPHDAPPTSRIPIWDAAPDLEGPTALLLWSCLQSFVPKHFWPFSQTSFLIVALCALLIDPIIEKCLQSRDQRSFDQLRSDPLGICSIVPFNRHQYQSLCSDVQQDKAMKWCCLRFNPYVYCWLQGKKKSTIANILNVDQLGMCVSVRLWR